MGEGGAINMSETRFRINRSGTLGPLPPVVNLTSVAKAFVLEPTEDKS